MASSTTSSVPLYPREREAVVRACQQLAADGHLVGTAGNVSIRVGEHVIISPSGVSYAEMSPADVGIHDLSGAPVQATLAPSSELPLHLAVYASSGHTTIVHTHSTASTALSTVVAQVPPTHYYCVLFGGPIRVAPYARFGTDELARNVTHALTDRTAALMANHGAVIVGSDLSRVVSQVPYLEYLCDVQLRAGAYGSPATLTEQELATAAEAMVGYGQTGSGAPR
ncbi:MAG: class II aldolase/adducin family protein [Nostocoides sp.]